MKYYFENSHCTPVLGGMMVDTMFGNPGANHFGVALTRSNVHDHLSLILADRAEYARTNAADIHWVDQIMTNAVAKQKKPR